MVVHKFELVNGDWSHSGITSLCTHALRELENSNLLNGRKLVATTEGKTLTVEYNDDDLSTRGAKKLLQLLTARLAHNFVVTHGEVTRKGANIIRFRYIFERTA